MPSYISPPKITVEHSIDGQRWKKIDISSKTHIANELSKTPTYFDGIANYYRRSTIEQGE